MSAKRESRGLVPRESLAVEAGERESKRLQRTSKSTLMSAITLAVALSALATVAQQVPQGNPKCLGAKAGFSMWMDVSPPLRDMKPTKTDKGREIEDGEEVRNPSCEHMPTVPQRPQADSVVQNTAASDSMPPLLKSWDGITGTGVVPPDTEGDVGLHDYVQWVNFRIAIWDKDGTLLYGPVPGNTIWQGFGGPMDTCNNGDPIVVYDRLANRWLIAQIAMCNVPPTGPFYEYVAVSETGDPTGAWYRYAFEIPGGYWPDYPKFGVWPDGYYMSYLQASSLKFGGAGVMVFDRTAMIEGQPQVAFQYFSPGDVGYNMVMLPSHFDGKMPPPEGTPDYFVALDVHHPNQLLIWAFHTDWDNPLNSYFGQADMAGQPIATAPFNYPPTTSYIPQPDGATTLNYGPLPMYRLAYRNMGSYQIMAFDHTVAADQGQAGIRWYELKNTGGLWNIDQQGTFAPDSDYRWMGSCATDHAGNLAVGYSVSSTMTYPSIRCAGRLSTDPPNTLGQGETSIIAGGGSQLGLDRWGDYSTMSVDPADDCTFWYTQEYYPATSNWQWHTRIASFRFPNCVLHVAPSATPSSGSVPLPVTFTATATNGQEPLQYEWDFGDGTTGSGVSVSHTYVTTGTFQWEVTVTDVAGASVAANGTLLVTCPAIAVSPQVLSPGVRGNAYSQAFFANVTDGPLQGRLSESTNPLSWSESGPLPSGMTFSSGLLSGTPLEAGEFPITVACTDEYGCMASRSYTLSIECPDIAVYPASLPSGTAGMSYPPVSFSLTGGSGNIVWNLNGILPDGMDFGGDTLEGIPSQTGTFDLTFSATDRDGCSGSRRCFLVIGCPSVTVQQRSLPSTAVGALYDQSLSSSGGIEPYTYSVASGTLPPGVTLSAGGTLSGSPTASGTFAFTVDVTDANGCTGGAIYSIGVAPPPAVDLIRKVGSPFRLVVKGSNLQSGIRVFINDTEWNYLKYKSTSKIKLIGGRALKAVVPKGVSVNFAFVNPDGGRVVVLGWSR